MTEQEINREFNNSFLPLNKMDVVHGFLWDSITYSQGATLTKHNSDMFRVPIGMDSLTGSGTKHYSDTSMYSACKLDAPESFAIKRIIFTFAKSCDDHDMYHILESHTYMFWMGQKMYARAVMITLPTTTIPVAPIRVCEYCRSVYANQEVCPRCGATHFSLSSLGESNGTQYVMELGINLVLANQMSFHLNFDGPDYVFRERFKMWCHFEGLHARGIQ